MVEHLTLYGAGLFHLFLDSYINLFPETEPSTCKKDAFAHRLLYLLRICVDNQLATFTQTEIGPSTLEDG